MSQQTRLTSFFPKSSSSMATATVPGQIRVGRREFCKRTGRALPDPSWPSFTPIVVMTPRSAYGPLSPYSITDHQGRIIECVYQASKVYATVPAIDQSLGKWSHLRWSHPAEVHIEPATGHLTQAYVDWRTKLAAFPEAVRYPVGWEHRHMCLGAIASDEDVHAGQVPLLLVISSRASNSTCACTRMGWTETLVQQLRARHLAGENLLIIEVDVAPQRSLAHYQSTYGVGADFIERNTQHHAALAPHHDQRPARAVRPRLLFGQMDHWPRNVHCRPSD